MDEKKFQPLFNRKESFIHSGSINWEHVVFNEYYDTEGSRIIFQKLCFGPLETITYGKNKKGEFYCEYDVIEPELFQGTDVLIMSKQEMIDEICSEIELLRKHNQLNMVEALELQKMHL